MLMMFNIFTDVSEELHDGAQFSTTAIFSIIFHVIMLIEAAAKESGRPSVFQAMSAETVDAV